MRNQWTAFNQLINTCIWLPGDGFGMPDETISARCWRRRDVSNAYKWINRLFWWQENHCLLAYQAEMKQRHKPAEYRA
jgi:hypothetical protein